MRIKGRSRKGLAMFATALVAMLLAWQAWDEYRAADRRLGGIFEPADVGMQVSAIDAGSALDRAGIEEGDRLVRLGDRSVDDLLELTRALADLEVGQAVPATVLRGDRRLHFVLHPGGGRVPWGSFALSVLTALAYLALGILALVQSGPDLRADLLACFSLAVAVEISMPVGIVDPWALLLTPVVFYLLAGLEIGLELHLLSLIPDRPGWLRSRPWMVPLCYSVGLVVGLIPAATFLLYLFRPDVVGSDLLADVENAFFSGVFPVWAVLAVGILLPRALYHPNPVGRQQAGLVFVGIAPWALYVLSWVTADLSSWTLPSWFLDLENLVLLCFPVAVFAAIFRAHLFDLELVVRRSLVYGLLTGTLVLVFYAVLGAGGALLSGWLGGESPVLVVSLATLILGLLFAPLRRTVQKLIEGRFFPERRAMRQRLIELAEDLPSQGRLSRMAEHLAAQLRQIFAVTDVSVWIADPADGSLRPADGGSEPLPRDDAGLAMLRGLRRPQPARTVLAESRALAQREALQRAAMLAPLTRRDQLVGMLALGPKRRGDRFPAEELELLGLFSHHVATALENARLFESATIEGLTGLYRREVILEKTEHELERARRYGRPLTLALLDLDRFKDINDRYGHLAGDYLLRELARTMANDLRGTDALGRYGGEEFLLLLPETDAEGAWRVAEKLRRRVETLRVTMEDGTEVGVTVSVGLASWDTESGDETSSNISLLVRNLLAQADRALYLAKRSGRNQVQPALCETAELDRDDRSAARTDH